eukprot:PITA_33405
MNTLFSSQDIWDLVENDFQEPADAATYNALSQQEKDLLKNNRKKDSKGLFYIFQAVHESIFPRVAATTKSKQAWDTLQTTYQGMAKVKIAKLQMLRRDFGTLCIKESENIGLFFTHGSGLVTQIRSHGETLEEIRIVEKVLRSFPTRFEAIVVAIEERKDLSQFLVDELNASLISHEHRLNRTTSSSLEHAFKTQVSFGQGRDRGRSYARGRGRSLHRGGRSRPSGSNERGNNQNPSQGPSQNQAQVSILTKKGEKEYISDVYFVPGLKHNLVSVGQLMQKGYNVFFKNDVCTILDRPPRRQLIAKVQMTNNRMFPLKIISYLQKAGAQAKLSMNSQEDGRKDPVVTQVNFQAEVKDENCLSHLRFGHLNFGGLNLLHKKDMVKGLPLIEKPDSRCEGYILGKQHRETFPARKLVRAKAPLEIVHLDLCGPMSTLSFGGSHYVLTFIDDYTRKTWVFLLKQKSEVFECFRQYEALVEKQSGHYIKVLRTDRGGEYISNDFLRFCREHGIHKQFTTRYTLQQNGVAERNNRTIMEMARSMLKAKHLPNDYWVEAVAYATYILNRCPTKSV